VLGPASGPPRVYVKQLTAPLVGGVWYYSIIVWGTGWYGVLYNIVGGYGGVWGCGLYIRVVVG